MKKILYSALGVGVTAALAVAATGAFFSDTETSVGNTFQAGAIDLKIDYESTYTKDGVTEAGPSWDLQDLTGSEQFFNLDDLKPGDYGEGTISMHVYNNDAYACVSIIPTLNDDMSSTEPELEAGDVANTDSIFDGELAQNLHFEVWVDDGDNILNNGEVVLIEGEGPITPETWMLAGPGAPLPVLTGSQDYFLGVAWSLPGEVGNVVQTDKYMADVSFYVEQARNNDGFVCPTVGQQESNVLRLENEEEVVGGPWKVLSDDNMYVDMTYNSSGSTFDYTLVGQGLLTSTEYSLIYYADGWPGSNPGALIGTHTTDGGGALNVALVNKELNMDLPTLPDGNFAVGAKIWLIPSTAYDAGTKSVTVWPPDFNTWLFEGNVYINYDDIDIP